MELQRREYVHEDIGYELTYVLGFRGYVHNFLVVPDGKLLISSTFYAVYLWSIKDGNLLKTRLVTPELLQGEIAYDSKTRRVFIPALKHVWVWSIDSTNEEDIESLHVPGDVTNIAFDSKSETLWLSLRATKRIENVEVWSLKPWKFVRRLSGHHSRCESVICDENRRLAFTGSKDTTVRVWNLDSGECLKVLTGHIYPISRLYYDPESHSVLSSASTCIRLWSVETGKCLRMLNFFPHNVFGAVYDHKLGIFIVTLSNRTIVLESFDRAKGRFATWKTNGVNVIADYCLPGLRFLGGGATDAVVLSSYTFEEFAKAFIFAFYGKGSTTPSNLFDSHILGIVRDYWGWKWF